MSNTNVVVVTGNLGAEVEFRVIPQSETAVAEIRIAVNKHRPNPEAESGFDTITSWVTVKFYGKLAERAKAKLSIGVKVAITGELAEDTWVDKPTGKNRSKLYVVGNAFEPLARSARSSQSANNVDSQSQNDSNHQRQRSQHQSDAGVRSQSKPAGYNEH